MVTVAWLCLLQPADYHMCVCHALPPRRPEDRGALWTPVSWPRLRLERGVEGGRGPAGWGRGSAAGLLCQGEGQSWGLAATQKGFLPTPALHG